MIKRWVLVLLMAGTGWARADFDMVANTQYKKSAEDFLHKAIPAIVESGDISEFTRRAPHPVPMPMYTQRIAWELKLVHLLGKVVSYGDPKVTIMVTQQPTGQLVTAGFDEMVTFEKGRVAFAGNLDKSGQPWGFFSFDPLPQGRAWAMLMWGRSGDLTGPMALYAGVDDEPYFEDAMTKTLGAELDKKYFDELDQEITDPAQYDLRLKDGTSKICMVSAGLKDLFVDTQARSKYYPLVQEWRAKEPQSGPAAIAEALYWLKYGWDARGGGYSDSVTESGDQLFRQRLHKAEAILLASKSFASNTPLWYATYMNTEMGLGDYDKLHAAFVEGNKRFPNSDILYRKAVQALQPRWYGSYAAEDDLIRQAVEKTRAKEGEGLYAVLYWHLSDLEDSDFELFRDSQASWPRMKEGFEDLMKHHPGSLWLLNHYAAYACRANDRTTFLKLDPQLQGQDANSNSKLIESAWPGNHSHDLCENMFGAKQQANHAPAPGRE